MLYIYTKNMDLRWMHIFLLITGRQLNYRNNGGEKEMKNVLIISSSPRKYGNSQILCEQFKKGAEAKGHQVKIVRIMEQKIGFCRACDGCMRNGGTCVLKDDMNEILKMFQEADVLVLATPVYFYGVSAQMKTFIDRTYPIWQHLGKKEV